MTPSAATMVRRFLGRHPCIECLVADALDRGDVRQLRDEGRLAVALPGGSEALVEAAQGDPRPQDTKFTIFYLRPHKEG